MPHRSELQNRKRLFEVSRELKLPFFEPLLTGRRGLQSRKKDRERKEVARAQRTSQVAMIGAPCIEGAACMIQSLARRATSLKGCTEFQLAISISLPVIRAIRLV